MTKVDARIAYGLTLAGETLLVGRRIGHWVDVATKGTLAGGPRWRAIVVAKGQLFVSTHREISRFERQKSEAEAEGGRLKREIKIA